MSDEYQSKSLNIRRLASIPPDQLIDHLSAAYGPVGDAAPGIVPHMHSSAINAIQFLNSKLPSVGNELIGDSEELPARAKRQDWLDLHNTVTDPTSILDHVKNGTLNQHHVEAISSVYPDLHQEIVQKLGEGMGSAKMSGTAIPYKRKQSIGLLMGAPMDSTMTPQARQSIIYANRPNSTQAQKANQPNKASGVELKQVNSVNKLYQTPLEARAADKKD
jgi:hypothetical protein